MNADRQWETALIRSLQAAAEDLAAQCGPGQAKAALERLAEDLRFSDPVSHPALAEAEGELTACFQELEQAAAEGDEGSIPALCGRAQAALSQRNRLCKLNKKH